MKTRITITLLLTGLAGFSAQASEIILVHPDHQGNPIAYTDINGNVIGREYYTPDGETLNPPTTDDQISYTGHVKDSATGLIYMQARYYDPVVGRFLSVDPVTFSPDRPDYFNRYWYAGGNPMNNTDPDGRCFIPPTTVVCIVAVDALAKATIYVGSAVLVIAGVVDVMNNEQENSEPGEVPKEDGVKIGEKISDQLGDRGWTEEEVQEIAQTEPTGTSTDNTGGKNDSATVFGTKDGGHVVVNDKTNEVVQISDKNDPDWKPDPRIEWKEGM